MAAIAPVLLRRPGSLRPVQRLRALPAPALAGVAAVLGLVGGGLTSYAQTVLPEVVASFANSASGWTVLVVLIVALLRARPPWSAVVGVVGFAGLTLGYQVVSTMRGFPTDESFWLVAGVVVGPFVGIAGAWLRARGWRSASAAALLAGIGLGEAVYGLTAIAATTSPVYWTAIGLASVALVGVVTVRRTTRWRHRVLAPAGALLVAAALVAAYSAL